MSLSDCRSSGSINTPPPNDLRVEEEGEEERLIHFQIEERENDGGIPVYNFPTNVSPSSHHPLLVEPPQPFIPVGDAYNLDFEETNGSRVENELDQQVFDEALLSDNEEIDVVNDTAPFTSILTNNPYYPSALATRALNDQGTSTSYGYYDSFLQDRSYIPYSYNMQMLEEFQTFGHSHYTYDQDGNCYSCKFCGARFCSSIPLISHIIWFHPLMGGNWSYY